MSETSSPHGAVRASTDQTVTTSTVAGATSANGGASAPAPTRTVRGPQNGTSDLTARLATIRERSDFVAASAPESALMADVARLLAAAEAVVGLHKPFVWDFGFGPVTSCRGCADQGADEEAAHYPCPTVRALTDALGEK